MSPLFAASCDVMPCFPRVSGDEPLARLARARDPQFSPRERG